MGYGQCHEIGTVKLENVLTILYQTIRGSKNKSGELDNLLKAFPIIIISCTKLLQETNNFLRILNSTLKICM